MSPHNETIPSPTFADDLATIERIDAVPRILEVVCRTTGLGFAAVARVTPDRWIACAVRDEIAFGLAAGGELPVETTICHEIRASGCLVVIDHVDDDERFCRHATPKLYGFQSYISVPITLKNGAFFGTLCAIDPRPARLSAPETISMFMLFAELIAFHLDARDRLSELEACVANRTTALRDVNHALERQMAVADGDREALRALTQRLERAREDERTSIARELHDAFGQSLTALTLDLAATRKMLAQRADPELDGVLANVLQMEQIVETTLDDIERIVAELRPAVLDTLGCVAAAEWLLSQIRKRTGLRTEFEGDHDLELPAEVATAIFRILQEALTNVCKHACASAVHVTLVMDGPDVLLRVRDDGRGLTQADREKPSAFGLRGITERVRTLHGSLSITSASGGGLDLAVRMPGADAHRR